MAGSLLRKPRRGRFPDLAIAGAVLLAVVVSIALALGMVGPPP
jgi:hypothetical protein